MSEHVLNSHALTAELRQFHDVHSPPLYRFLLRLTLGERHTAEDYLQETMLRAWRCWPDLPKDNEIQRRWLFTVARRVAIDAGRARQARPTEVGVTDIVSWLPAAGDAVDSVVSVQTVRAALTRLSPDHRAVLIELYYNERSTVETASRLGIPEGTVKSRAHYALRSLRAVIGPADEC